MDAWIVEALRTPRGRGKPDGALASVAPVTLLADLVRELVRRVGAAEIDDVVVGCAAPTGDQGSDIGRLVALCAGLEGASGSTVSRFCASGLDAIATAAARVGTGMESAVVAGGVEMLSRVPMFADAGPWFADAEIAERTGFVHMGVAADLLASLEGIGKPELDALAVESHRRAARAVDEGRFRSLVPVTRGDRTLLAADEGIRRDLDEASLAARPGAFAPDADARRRIAARFGDVEVRALHQSRSSPALADGAAAALIANEATVSHHGWSPRARVRSWAHAAVDPTLMLTGNVDATRRALGRAGLRADAIDVFEVNESFAAVPIHFASAMGISRERLNPNGGAIAMGHPLGATGGVLVSSALDELERVGGRYAVASICGGAGVATALVLERA
ncbi:MAG: acetyl-CoA C-acyltransferase [Sandaracinaceae bacterium]|nr:acetyl-CoA C-acyltransferase [Sandaracinaceae bacterium]